MFGLGLLTGLAVGVPLGVFIAALCAAASRADEIIEYEHNVRLEELAKTVGGDPQENFDNFVKAASEDIDNFVERL